MSILTLFVVIPLLMLLGLWLSKNLNQVRGVMVVGATALLALSIWLTVYFIDQRASGNTANMLLTYSVTWFEPLKIAYSVGVDGISVVMILLSAIIVFTGTFASWQLKPLTKEYFLWFVLLSIGVFGFFISTDMFTMFMFYEVALIPMYLLIGVWGTGPKEYSAMKLTLMLMGGSALLILGILGWAGIARLVRGQILPLRKQEFMTATEACGISVKSRIFKHLIPNVIPQLIVNCTMGLGPVIITEATLSFLGLGVKFPFASWGNIINDVNNTHTLTTYWFIWIPAGMLLLLTDLAFKLVGDGLRDAFDPKMKR